MYQLSYTDRPEQHLSIPIPGTHKVIHGVLRGDWSQPLVILVHGLVGASHDVLEFIGAKFLAEHGYATLRIDLYGSAADARDVVDCTLHTHVADFETVVAYAHARGVPQIFAIGHSYGGLTILYSHTALAGAVLWEPSSFAFSKQWDEEAAFRRIALPNHHVLVDLEGAGYLVPEAMVTERQVHAEDSLDIANKPYPVLFVSAGRGVLADRVAAYAAHAAPTAGTHVIAGATHNFRDSDTVMFELFAVTKDWFDRCLA